MNSKHQLIMFKVEVYITENYKSYIDDVMYCIGIEDVQKYVKKKRKEIGIEKYNGYSTEAIPLSSYSASIIKKGVETLKV